MSQKYFCLKVAEKEKSRTFGRSVLGCGAWFKFGTVSQFFQLERVHWSLSCTVILRMGLGWAKENFGTQCPKNIFV